MKNIRKHDIWILLSLWLLMFSASSQLMILAPILPQIGRQLHIPENLQGTLVTAYAVALAVFAVIMGPISDRIGRRRVLLLGTGSMALSLALHNLAVDYYSMLVVRAAAGMAGGMLSGASVSYVGDYFPYERRGWANGWIATGISAGQILGIPTGTILAGWLGVSGPFSFFAVTMAAAFMLIWRCVPQPNVPRHDGRWTLAHVGKSFVELIRNRTTAATAAVYGLMFLSFSIYVVYLPTWLAETFQIRGTEIASLFFIGGIASVITGPNAGSLSDRIGRRKMIVISCLGLAMLMIATTFVLTHFWEAYILFIGMMSMVAMRISPLQALVSEIVPAKQRGAFLSLTIALGQVGMGLGGAFAGLVYSNLGFFGNTVLGSFFVLLMGVLVWRAVPEPALSATDRIAERTAA